MEELKNEVINNEMTENIVDLPVEATGKSGTSTLLKYAVCFVAGGVVLPLAKRGIKAVVKKIANRKKKPEEDVVYEVDGEEVTIVDETE